MEASSLRQLQGIDEVTALRQHDLDLSAFMALRADSQFVFRLNPFGRG